MGLSYQFLIIILLFPNFWWLSAYDKVTNIEVRSGGRELHPFSHNLMSNVLNLCQPFSQGTVDFSIGCLAKSTWLMSVNWKYHPVNAHQFISCLSLQYSVHNNLNDVFGQKWIPWTFLFTDKKFGAFNAIDWKKIFEGERSKVREPLSKVERHSHTTKLANENRT